MSDWIQESGDFMLCRPEVERIDADEAPRLKKEIMHWVEQGKRRFVINLEKVRFIDSAGLSVLVALSQKIPVGGAIRLCCVSAQVHNVFSMTRLDRLFPEFKTEEEALARTGV